MIQLLDLIYDSGHYDEKNFPWHFNTINVIIEHIEKFILSTQKEKRMELVIGLFYHPLERISEIIYILLFDLDREKLEKMCHSFLQRNIQPSYISETDRRGFILGIFKTNCKKR